MIYFMVCILDNDLLNSKNPLADALYRLDSLAYLDQGYTKTEAFMYGIWDVAIIANMTY